MTPSAYAASDFACSRVETPRPTEIGSSVTERTRETRLLASDETLVRVPVTPIKLAAYTNPPVFAVTSANRESLVLGATT